MEITLEMVERLREKAPVSYGQAKRALETLGGRVEALRDYAIPGTDVRHRLIIVKKIRPTGEKYPRAFAKIKKNPL